MLHVQGQATIGCSTYRTRIDGSSAGTWISFGTLACSNFLGKIGTYSSAYILDSNNGDISFRFCNCEKAYINSSGQACFLGSITAGNSTFTNGTGLSQVTIGQLGTGYSALKLAIDSTKYSWAIIDEIVYSQKIINKVFDSKIPELFIKSPFIMYILDETVQRLKQPNLLYLCNKPESVYKNVENIQNIDSIKIIDETIDHELFGSYYICSSMPINGADLTKIKRYAAFTYSPKYILKDISTISQEDKDELIEEFEDSNILSIYFREDGIQLWGIQTSDQITII